MINIIILRIKLLLSYLRNHDIFEIPAKGKKIFIFLGADYGNLGDVAITFAQTKYLIENYPDYTVVEIPISKTFAGIKAAKKVISKDDIITLIGGGNTSDLYDDIEFLRQLVVYNFRHYKIIAFPQTFDFSDTFRGRICKWLAYRIYRLADDFLLMARERNTMNVITKHFPRIYSTMMPDVVMTLDERKETPRKGALICLRSDKECSVTEDVKAEIVSKVKEQYGLVDMQDTQVDNVNASNRFEKFEDILKQFRSHELVITDRLHGMILCFITGTPALVLDNSNHKISACFEWIKDCGFIKMIDGEFNISLCCNRNNFDKVSYTIINTYKKKLCQK